MGREDKHSLVGQTLTPGGESLALSSRVPNEGCVPIDQLPFDPVTVELALSFNFTKLLISLHFE